MIEIKDLHVSVEGKEILKGVNLSLEKGRVYVLMGVNGSGKSTLANVLMGNPIYKIEKGTIEFGGKNINELDASERAKLGMFLSFQYPVSVGGVSMSNFLRESYNSLHEEKKSLMEFKSLLKEKAGSLGLGDEFTDRYLNEGFSGGEKKKSEILQLSVLNPKFAILDETDSGLDIDSLRNVAENVSKFVDSEKCVLIITHYKRILDYIKADEVFVMDKGKIVLKGGSDIVDKLEDKGYGWIEKDLKIQENKIKNG